MTTGPVSPVWEGLRESHRGQGTDTVLAQKTMAFLMETLVISLWLCNPIPNLKIPEPFYFSHKRELHRVQFSSYVNNCISPVL